MGHSGAFEGDRSAWIHAQIVWAFGADAIGALLHGAEQQVWGRRRVRGGAERPEHAGTRRDHVASLGSGGNSPEARRRWQNSA